MSYFRTVYLALSSALRRFTVLFGMGRRGTTSLLPPGKTGCLVLNKLKEVWVLKIAGKLALGLVGSGIIPDSQSLIHKAIGSSRTGN